MTPPIRQAAVLVGGLGTRLGDLTRTVPKPLLPCGDRPFLAWILRELCRFGIEETLLLTGHLAGAVDAAVPELRAGLPKPMTVRCVPEPAPAGTGGALRNARDHLAERFVLCNGDSWLDFNLARLLADAAADGPDVAGRMVLRHLDDASRYGVADVTGDRVTGFRERPGPGEPGHINAGIYLLSRTVLADVAETCSLERDVLPALAARGALRATAGAGYFVDIGIPDDFARAQRDLPARLRRRALFLDRDGVINADHGHVGARDRFAFIPGAIETIRAAADRGWHVFVVTNQSGIARGFYTEADFAALSDWVTGTVRAGGGTIDDWRFCPFHPDASVAAYRARSDWRKPAPGMLVDLLRCWGLDPARCVMIGDQPTDLRAAAAAGIAGHLFPGGDLAAFALPLLTGG